MRRLNKALRIILCIVIALCAIGYGLIRLLITPEKVVKKGQLKELTIEEKLEDFRCMYDILRDSFPFYMRGEKIHCLFYEGSSENFSAEDVKLARDEQIVWSKSLDFYLRHAKVNVY